MRDNGGMRSGGDRTQRQHATVWAMAQRLAIRLGAGWKAELNQHSELAGPSHERLRIAKVHRRTVTIYVEYGEHATYLSLDERHAVARLTVSDDKSIDDIATAIQQRLLPKYRPMLSAAINRHAEFQAEEAKRHENQGKLAMILGLPPDHSRPRLYIPGRNPISGHIIARADSANISISDVPMHIATEIVKLIAASSPDKGSATDATGASRT